MIAIKGMEMPKNCSQCNLCVEDKYADMTCTLLGEEWEETDYNENHRDEKCPLVEIVTCKDCKYYRNKGNKYSYCTKRLNVDSITDRYREPDYFCANGERKEFLKRIIPYDTEDKTDKALYNFALITMMGTPNANVVEREKIDKAIEVITKLRDSCINMITEENSVANECYEQYANCYDECLKIIKQNIGESE
jgi:hypothetical protein